MAGEAKVAPTKVPQQSWVSRHKVAVLVWTAIVVGLAVGLTIYMPT